MPLGDFVEPGTTPTPLPIGRLLRFSFALFLGYGFVSFPFSGNELTDSDFPGLAFPATLYWIGVAFSWWYFSDLARIHRCGAALGLEQGVRAVGRDGPRSIPINGAGGGLWLSLGAPMAVLGSGAGAGSAGQYAGEDNRGPGRCDSVGRLGSLVDGSGAVGAVRQAMAGLAIEPGRE